MPELTLAEPVTFASGSRLADGRFEVVRPLGRGAMGSVYEVFDHELQMARAVKTLAAKRPELLVSLKREFRALRDVTHPNLVSYGELHEDDGQYFFTMELVRGTSFDAWVRPEGALDRGRLRAATLQLVRALRALHRASRIHRDVKPSNVMVDTHGRLILLDLGLAGATGIATGQAGGGTLAYAAPEQLRGAPPEPSADWYAVGTMLYEALFGELPFGSDTDTIRQRKLATDRVTCAQVPEGELVSGLLDPDPRTRWSGRHVLERFGGLEAHVVVTPAIPPLVGRDVELGRLEGALREGRSRPMHVHVFGQPGLGRTALLDAFADHAARQGALVLRGSGHVLERLPFQALDGVVDGLASHIGSLAPELREELLPKDAALLGKAFPVFAPHAGPAALGATPGPQDLRRRLFAALRELLARVADRRRTVVIVDGGELHDGDSVAGIQAVLREGGPGRPLLTFVSAGVEPDGDADLELPLGPLDLAASRTLAGVLLGPSASVDGDKDAIAQTIAERSGGHPGRIHLLAMARPADTVGDALEHLLAELGAPAQRLWELIQVGGSVPFEVVAHELGSDLDSARRAFTSLRAARLVAGAMLCGARLSLEWTGAGSEVESLPEVHRRLATAYAARAPRAHDALSRHWEGAGDPIAAAHHAEQAGHAAAAALAFDRATAFYERASRLSERADA